MHIWCGKLPHTIQSYASLQSFFFSLLFRFLSAKKYRSYHTSMVHRTCCSIWRSSWHFNSLFQWLYSRIEYSHHTYTQNLQTKRLPKQISLAKEKAAIRSSDFALSEYRLSDLLFGRILPQVKFKLRSYLI